MIDTHNIPPSDLDLVSTVLRGLLANSPDLRADQLMVVGAACRDLLHTAAGHSTLLRPSNDVDIGIGLSDWLTYEQTVAPMQPTGTNGIRYLVDEIPVDLLPFGDIEDPAGTVQPRTRPEGINVRGFSEVFEHSVPLSIPEIGTIALPTVPGYAALKLFAWADRSVWGVYRDAVDLATCLYWYEECPEVQDRIWTTQQGQEALISFDADVRATSAYLLARDTATLIGPTNVLALAYAWKASKRDQLPAEMIDPQNAEWQVPVERRQQLIEALEIGLWPPPRPTSAASVSSPSS